MGNEKIELILENVGGLLNEHKFTLQKGINVIRAPNAAGKSSFIKGLQLATLPAAALKNPQMLGLIHRTARKGRVEFSGSVQLSREFKVENDGIYASGKTLHADGIKANTLSIVTPENELLSRIETGKSVRDLFEEFSGAKYYTFMENWLVKLEKETKLKLDEYRENERELEQLTRLKEELISNLKRLEKELNDLPLIEDIKSAVEEDKKKKEFEKIHSEHNSLKDQIRDLQRDIEKWTEILKQNEKSLKENEDLKNRFFKEHPNKDLEEKNINKKIEELRETIKTKREEGAMKYSALEIARSMKSKSDFSKLGRCLACGQSVTHEKVTKWIEELEKQEQDLRNEVQPVKEEINTLEKQKERLNKEFLQISKSVIEQIDKLNNNIKDIKTTRIQKYQDDKKKNEELLDPLTKKLEELSKKLDSRVRELYEKRGKLEGQISETEKRLKETNGEIEKYAEIETEIKKIRTKLEFLKAATGHFRVQGNTVRKAIIEKFSERIMKVYQSLGFSDFKNIYLDDNFNLKIERKGFVGDVHDLSGAERATIGVILILAGKEEYLKGYPFFAMDEVILAYDRLRMKRIIEYVKEHSPYVIVTSLATEGQEGIKIHYGANALA